MPLEQARLDLAAARSEIIRLHLEIVRLEHALASVHNLELTLRPVAVVVANAANHLTPRETEVLQRIMAGESVDIMARTMYMSRSTIKTHIVAIYHKLGVHNRGSAALAGVHLGLDVPEEEDGVSGSPRTTERSA